MIINEIPEVIAFDDVNEDDEVFSIEATVMFISTKYVQAENGSGGESFVVICYDSENNIYELFLNQVKIVKTKKYDKNRSSRYSSGKRGRKRAGYKQRDNHSNYKEDNPQERESETGGDGDTGETDGSKGGRKSIL